MVYKKDILSILGTFPLSRPRPNSFIKIHVDTFHFPLIENSKD